MHFKRGKPILALQQLCQFVVKVPHIFTEQLYVTEKHKQLVTTPKMNAAVSGLLRRHQGKLGRR